MNLFLLQLHVALRMRTTNAVQRLREEAGEGVISTGIAVLIMALLGAAMWVAFREIFDGAASKASGAVNSIGG